MLVRASGKKALANQEEKCRAFGRVRGFKTSAVYPEREILPFQRRRVLRWMVAYCRAHEEVGFVLAYRARSISRNNSELFLIRRLLKRYGLELVFVKDTPEVRF